MITERSHTERKAYSYLPWQKQTLKITDLNCHSYKNASVSSESGQTCDIMKHKQTLKN